MSRNYQKQLCVPDLKKNKSMLTCFDNCIKIYFCSCLATGSIGLMMKEKPTYQELEAEIKILKGKMRAEKSENITFQLIFDEIDVVVYVADIQTHELLFLNKSGKLIFGDKTGEKCYSVLRNGRTEPCKDCLLLDKEGNPAKEAYAWVFQDTTTRRWYQRNDKTAIWSDGRIVRIGIATDITASKNLENVLIEVQKVAHLGYWELDLIENKLSWSDEIYRIFDLDPRRFEATYQGFLNRVHPEDRERVDKAYTDSLKTKKDYEIEHRLLLENGEMKYVVEKCFTEYDDSGNPVRSIGTVLDITKQKEIEVKLKKQNEEYAALNEEYLTQNEEYATLNEEYLTQNEELLISKEKAEESDRLKSAFLANMSHEIRTPMNGILGFAELLKEPQLTGEEQQEYISIIEKSGDRMLNIINDIINISRIESGQTKITLAETNINKQAEFIYTFFKAEAEQKKIQLLLRNPLPEKDANIITDKEKIYAALTNLVKNAIKYTKKGSVEMGFEKKGKYLEFHVKDTGVGIPKDRQNLIFQRFVRADAEDMDIYEGTGLGLSITKAYVEMLGGEIWFKSVEGQGSQFYFTIPSMPL